MKSTVRFIFLYPPNKTWLIFRSSGYCRYNGCEVSSAPRQACSSRHCLKRFPYGLGKESRGALQPQELLLCPHGAGRLDKQACVPCDGILNAPAGNRSRYERSTAPPHNLSRIQKVKILDKGAFICYNIT